MILYEDTKVLLDNLRNSNDSIRNYAESQYQQILQNNLPEFVDILMNLIIEQQNYSYFSSILLYRICNNSSLINNDEMKAKLFEVILFFIQNFFQFSTKQIQNSVADIICQIIDTYNQPLTELNTFLMNCFSSTSSEILSFLPIFLDRLPDCQYESLKTCENDIYDQLSKFMTTTDYDIQYIGLQCISSFAMHDWQITEEFLTKVIPLLETCLSSSSYEIKTLICSFAKILNASEEYLDFYESSIQPFFTFLMNFVLNSQLTEEEISIILNFCLILLKYFADTLLASQTELSTLLDNLITLFYNYYYDENTMSCEDVDTYTNSSLYKCILDIYTFITQYENDNYQVYEIYLTYLTNLFNHPNYIYTWLGLEMLKQCISTYIERYNIDINTVFAFVLKSIGDACPLLRYSAVNILIEFISSYPNQISSYFEQIISSLLNALEFQANESFTSILIAICRALQLLLVAYDNDEENNYEEMIMNQYIQRYMDIFLHLLSLSSLKVQESIMLVIMMFTQLYTYNLVQYYDDIKSFAIHIINSSSQFEHEDLKGLTLECVCNIGKLLDINVFQNDVITILNYIINPEASFNPRYARCIISISQTAPDLLQPYLDTIMSSILSGCRLENYLESDDSLAHKKDAHCCEHDSCDHHHDDHDDHDHGCGCGHHCTCAPATYIPITQGGQGDQSVCTSSIQDLCEYIYLLISLLNDMIESISGYLPNICNMVISQLNNSSIPMVEQAKFELMKVIIGTFEEDSVVRVMTPDVIQAYLLATIQYLIQSSSSEDMSLCRYCYIVIYQYIIYMNNHNLFDTLGCSSAQDLIHIIFNNAQVIMERKHQEFQYQDLNDEIVEETNNVSYEDDIVLTGTGIIHYLVQYFAHSLLTPIVNEYLPSCFALISYNDPLYISLSLSCINDFLQFVQPPLDNYGDELITTIINSITTSYPPLRSSLTYCVKLLVLQYPTLIQKDVSTILGDLLSTLTDPLFKDSLFTWSNENTVSAIITIMNQNISQYENDGDNIMKTLVPFFPFCQDEEEAHYVYNILLDWCMNHYSFFIGQEFEGVYLVLSTVGYQIDNPTIVDNDMKLKFLSLLGEWNQTIPKEFLLQLKNKLVPEVNEKIHNELQQVHFIDTIW